MIFNEVFEACYREMAGIAGLGNKRSQEGYQRKRFNRAMLALRCQNYFLNLGFTNTTGAAGVTGISRTTALEKRLIIRGGGINAVFIGNSTLDFDFPNTGAVNVKLFRSGSNRAQISLESLRVSHLFSCGQAQKFALDWPVPWVIESNEIVLAQFTQAAATDATATYALGLYGVTVDPKMRCDERLLDDLRNQIINTAIQKPRYIHLKTDPSAGTIVLPVIPAGSTTSRTVANTIEVPEHMLVIGWRRMNLGMFGENDDPATVSQVRLVVTGGAAFSRIEIPVKAFEYFARPDEGYFKFAVPHLIPKGSSLSLSVQSGYQSPEFRFTGEIELLCITV